uniref:Forkhead box O4 n=1 Tax=Andrias davidianus TaxID=141262 RepID=A0A2I7MLF7_ANDDA|nr:foxo4 [Andrias davidianus]QBY35560.1 forkhead box O4 [Andrias davidianus]
MEGALEQGSVDIDPDFEPQSRPRSCTWPLPRPDLSIVKQEPQSEGTPVEEGRCDGQDAALSPQHDLESRNLPEGVPGLGSSTPRKGGSRRNAWGNQSYAELISQAIETSPEKRLTLSQIYEWMVKSVPFFKDKGDSNSSAGWKNSIRHNLSLHSKFIKVHNEATGKSSWWMLNPDGGKSGKAPRRRAASMDNSSKLSKVRGKVSKKKAAMQASQDNTADSPGSQFANWPGSPSSRSIDDSDVWTSFRPRTSSNASTISARLSPIMNEQDDLTDEDLHPSLVYSSASSNVPPTVTEELELIDGLNLMSPSSSLLPSQQSLTNSLMQRSASFSLRPQSAANRAASFGNSLFNPMDLSLQSSASHFSGSQTLEALLTSDSPPPSDVMMTQVDPILTQTGSRLNSHNLIILGGPASQSKQSHMGNVLGQQQASLGVISLPTTLTLLVSPQNSASLSVSKGPGQSSSNPAGTVGSQPPMSSTGMMPFGSLSQDKLPTDLDIDMILENLECDVDYIINSDLMDGDSMDFNFDPMLPSTSYPNTSQASTHSWVPS